MQVLMIIWIFLSVAVVVLYVSAPYSRDIFFFFFLIFTVVLKILVLMLMVKLLEARMFGVPIAKSQVWLDRIKRESIPVYATREADTVPLGHGDGAKSKTTAMTTHKRQ